jgi:hypothetical protein
LVYCAAEVHPAKIFFVGRKKNPHFVGIRANKLSWGWPPL